MAEAMRGRKNWEMMLQSPKEGWRNEKSTSKCETIISRLRFGHYRLNGTLFKMVKHDSGRLL